MSRTWLLAQGTLHVLVLAAAVMLGLTYPRRMTAPGGYRLVSVPDAGARAPYDPPRQVVMAVIDGLGWQDARTMGVARWFAQHGRCFETHVGSPSISRALYTVLSSGVEQDRTGVRSNDGTAPAPVESVWDTARAAGRRVRAVSPIQWWTDLFPRGFDEYQMPLLIGDAFAEARQGEVNLVHVLYVDDAGHAHGAASPQYRQAVARADRELGALVRRTDLSSSLLVLTADHGHAARGGHGGLEPRVATVLTCFAGKHVRAEPGTQATIHATAVAPAVALLAGVPFPRHMRAGDDDLDAVLTLARTDDGSAAYVADRRETVARFRAANRAAVGASWEELYARLRGRQQLLGLGVVALLGVVLVVSSRPAHVAWALGTVGLMMVLVAYGRGAFDLTAVNRREGFVAAVGATCLAAGLASALAFAWLRRNLEDALRLQTPLLVLLLGATLGHAAVYGFTLGFPLPPPALLFLPLFSSLAAAATALVGLSICAVLALRRRP